VARSPQVEGLTTSTISARSPVRPLAGSAAGFVSRTLAMAIDLGVIVFAIVMGAVLGAALQLVLPHWSWLSTAIPAGIAAVSSFIPFVYFSALVAVTGRTIGKSVMGIRVVAADGRRLSASRSLLRTIGYLVSLLPLFAGFVWVLFDRDRRGWHDHLAGSRVVYEPAERDLA
jgi:uncharacterized RDD family membrane protein YckC